MSDTDRPMNQIGAPGLNQGHGHVFPRPDGARARCGGPGICSKCQSDAERKAAEQARRAADELIVHDAALGLYDGEAGE
jgi:hypothetical protein